MKEAEALAAKKFAAEEKALERAEALAAKEIAAKMEKVCGGEVSGGGGSSWPGGSQSFVVSVIVSGSNLVLMFVTRGRTRVVVPISPYAINDTLFLRLQLRSRDEALPSCSATLSSTLSHPPVRANLSPPRQVVLPCPEEGTQPFYTICGNLQENPLE